MIKFPDSELILNSDGSIYHLNLHPEEISDVIITVGDPDRVEKISRHFDKIEIKRQKRELVTHTGYYKGRRISIISSGMGVGCIDIVMIELDALANIDFKTREEKEKHTKLKIIRFGTCGCLQKDIPVNSFISTTYAVGMDNLLNYYRRNKTESEVLLEKSIYEYMEKDTNGTFRPYVSTSSSNIRELFKDSCVFGMNLTSPGFFASQGRKLRYDLAIPNLIDKLSEFRFQEDRLVNFEMESAAIFGLCNILGHECGAINLAIANRQTKEFSKDIYMYMDNMIQMGLERVSRIP